MANTPEDICVSFETAKSLHEAGINDDAVKKVFEEFENTKEINDAINVLSKRLKLPKMQVSNAIRQLCLSRKIRPNPYTNTHTPEEIKGE